jgi:hypothetical protein
MAVIIALSVAAVSICAACMLAVYFLTPELSEMRKAAKEKRSGTRDQKSSDVKTDSSSQTTK